MLNQWSNIHVRTVAALAAVVAATTLAACGGGSDTPAPAPTAAQKADIESVMLLPDRLFNLPQQLRNVWQGSTFVDPCASGTVTVQYDGAALALGSDIGAGQHLASGQFASCAYAFGPALVDGQLDYAYDWSPTPGPAALFYPFAGRLTATATNLRSTISGFADMTLNGVTEVLDSVTVNGNVMTLTITVTPTTGATMRNHASGRVATLRGGTTRQVQTIDFSGGAPTLTRWVLEHVNLEAEIGGRLHRIHGSEIYDFAPSGQPSAASGLIEVFVDGSSAALLEPALPQGYNVRSVSAQVGPF